MMRTVETPWPTMLGIVCLCMVFAWSLNADDASSSTAFEAGLKLFEKGEYVDAADKFNDAEILAESPDLKAQAAIKAAESYHAAGYLGKEYDAIEKVLENYPAGVDTGKLIEREFAIGDAFFHGYQDPAFWCLRFIPWLTDKDRMQEVYETAIKRAPYAPEGAMARLRLAIRHLKKGDNKEGIELLREVMQNYPNTEAGRFAMLELGNALCELSDGGDGDGAYYEEAMQVFAEFQKQYPDLSENEWVNIRTAQARDAYAERLKKIADFYESKGRTDQAEVYLVEILRRFPDTPAALKSEEMLTKLDKTYFPEAIAPEIPERYPNYEHLAFPKREPKLLLAPENSDNRFLLPIYDLNLPSKEKKVEAQQ